MKKLINWHTVFIVSLLALSAVLYSSQIFIFHKPRDTYFYIFQDIAFLPIYVIIVTLMVDKLLQSREQEALLNKMNMVIGAFFSELGNKLIVEYREFDPDAERTLDMLRIRMDWTEKDFLRTQKLVRSKKLNIECGRGDLLKLRSLLLSKRSFMLRLLENPNLLEHDTFSDLLWSVFHLTEELEYRKDPQTLCRPDGEHISNDMKRAFSLLIFEWLSYAKHLKKDYPYLYSLAVRTNPFDPASKAEIS